MAIDDTAVVSSTRGAVFVAESNTKLPSLKLFSLDADTVGDSGNKYTNIGHTSVDTLPEFSTDGGDSSTKDTWNKSKFRVTYETVTGKVTISSVQCDPDMLKLVFDAGDITGGGVAIALDKVEKKKAVFIYIEDTNAGEKLGFWLPNLSLAYSELPSLSQDGFNEYKIEGNILTSTALPKSASGKATSIGIYPPSVFATAA